MDNKKYISYFQSVITIGILSSGKNINEAKNKSKEKFLSEDGVNHCFFDQTPFELSESEEWTEEFGIEYGDGFKFNPDEKTKNVIATRMQKNPSDLTQEDIDQFLKESIETTVNSQS